MSENPEYTVYETDNAQPVTVTVNQNGEDLQQIQYITQDGTMVSAGQIVAGAGNVIQVLISIFTDLVKRIILAMTSLI